MITLTKYEPMAKKKGQPFWNECTALNISMVTSHMGVDNVEMQDESYEDGVRSIILVDGISMKVKESKSYIDTALKQLVSKEVKVLLEGISALKQIHKELR